MAEQNNVSKYDLTWRVDARTHGPNLLSRQPSHFALPLLVMLTTSALSLHHVHRRLTVTTFAVRQSTAFMFCAILQAFSVMTSQYLAQNLHASRIAIVIETCHLAATVRKTFLPMTWVLLGF